jgi:hypothetical protein
MGRIGTGVLAGAALTAGLALSAAPAGAADGDRHGSIDFDHTFTRDGHEVTCTVHGDVTYNPDARWERVFVEVRDDDPGCAPVRVGTFLAWTTESGDLAQAASTGPGPWDELVAEGVGSNASAEVFAVFACGPAGADECDTGGRHLSPK